MNQNYYTDELYEKTIEEVMMLSDDERYNYVKQLVRKEFNSMGKHLRHHTYHAGDFPYMWEVHQNRFIREFARCCKNQENEFFFFVNNCIYCTIEEEDIRQLLSTI